MWRRKEEGRGTKRGRWGVGDDRGRGSDDNYYGEGRGVKGDKCGGDGNNTKDEEEEEKEEKKKSRYLETNFDHR